MFDCLELTEDFLFLYFAAGISVHWYLRGLIYTACWSSATCFIWHAVASVLSILLARCLTLLAGNLSKSTFLHLWSWKQIPHHAGKKTKDVPMENLDCF